MSGYFRLGIDHLLGGNDHIIFIFGLLFLVSNLIVAIKTITAFTVAHSITLGLSVFGLISLPQATVEAIIALTIILFTFINFLGLNLKNIKQKNEKILSLIIGFFSGILGGLSTFYAPPIITFLVSLNFEKESFIRTTATMYFLASIPLYSSLIYHGLGNFYDLLISSNC